MTEPLLPLRRGGASSPEERAAATLLQQLPVPRTEGDAVDRVWRRVAARRPRARRTAWILSGALAAGIAALLLVPLGSPPPPVLAQARVVLLQGDVSRAPHDQWSAAAEGSFLEAGEQLRTAASARALLDVPGISALLLSQESLVAVEHTPQGVVVRLARGTVTAKVAHRKPGESFVVETDHARVTVVGTLFSVTAGPDGVTAVSVHEGAVAVTTQVGEAARVVAGTRWSSDHPGRDRDQISPQVATLLESCLLSPNAEGLRALFDATQVALAGPAVSNAPAAVVAPAPLPTAPPVVVATLSPHQAVAAHAHPRPAAIPVPDDPYGRAIELEAQGQHAEAAEAFARAAELDPRHGEAALYELGRIEHVRLHEPQKALDAFEQFRRRYPAGTFLPEVDLSVLEIDGALGRTNEQLTESEHFISAHPSDEHVDDVRLSLGHMRRDRGDCAGALALYRAITKASRLDDATYSVAYCLAQLGDRAGADQTLRSYLTRFPHGAHRADAMKALGENH